MRFDPLIGRQLASYRIDRLIGRGGMASVYYAVDIRLNRPAAVKVISPAYRENQAFTTRFIQEARAVASWRHENIVQVYHAGEEDGLFYFAMEYIDGVNLAQILSAHAVQGKRLPVSDVLRYGRAIASALDYAHRKGVIHRDVKPLNVLAASDGRVVLTDFGIALNTSQGSIGEVFGSPHYIAPEQARRSNEAVPQSDLYSLGIMLYEMLTGTLPFDDPSPTSIALQHLTQPPPSPRRFNPALNEETEAVLLRALRKNPSERFSTAKALMDALEQALYKPLSPGVTTPPRPSIPQPVAVTIPPPEPLPTTALPGSFQSSRRKLVLSVLVVAIIIVYGISAVFLLSLGGDPRLDQKGSSIFSRSTPTQKYSDRRGFKLLYNESSFYMLQTSGVGDLIAGVSFERLDANDRPVNRYSGNRWAEFSKSSLRSWCFRLEIADARNYLNPGDCGERYLATLHLAPESREIFWTSRQDSQVFRVLWWDEELMRCEIRAGTCEVFLP